MGGMHLEPESLSETTNVWLSQSDLKTRQALGQYMTPRFLRQRLLDFLNIKPGDTVLDPGVGTGEFLRDVLDREPQAKVFGWDIDEKILESSADLVPTAKLTHRSALDVWDGQAFDFVIGNPPYFEMKLAGEQRSRFKDVIGGRANIYALFFKAGLEALKAGGYLAYVVPPSMNAGAYFGNLRKYILKSAAIDNLVVFDDPKLFQDAQTSVQIIVLRKGHSSPNHTYKFGHGESAVDIFCESRENFLEQFEGFSSLTDLGYTATTGSIVWNLHKEILTNEPNDGQIPLIYARNLQNGVLSFNTDEQKPQYINKSAGLTGPAILVNRIVGTVGKGLIRSALVPEGMEFLAENHINVIRPTAGIEQAVSLNELFALINEPRILGAARLLTGNTQISASEWNKMLPIVRK